MFQWLMTKYYDKFMKDAEERGLRNWRRTLLQNISGDVIAQAGFKILEIDRQSMRGVPPIVRPCIRGVAVK